MKMLNSIFYKALRNYEGNVSVISISTNPVLIFLEEEKTTNCGINSMIHDSASNILQQVENRPNQ